MWDSKGSRIFLYLSVAAANLLAFSTGMALAWSSPMLAKLESSGDVNPLPEAITAEENSWIGSLLALGASLGPFPYGYALDKIGRKYSLLLVATPYVVAYLMAAFSQNVILFCVARFIAGLSVGGVFTVLPTYLAEVAEDSIRGMLGSTINNFLSFGLLISYVVGPYVSVLWFNVICALAPATFIALALLFVHDTSYYLLAKNDHDGAEKALSFIRSKSVADIQNELELIKQSVERGKAETQSIRDTLKLKGTTRALIISLALATFQQLSGINIVLFYTQQVFEASGTLLENEIPPMIIGSVQLISSFVTPIAVDRLGRKVLLVFSAVGMMVSEIPLGVYFYLKDDKVNVEPISWLPIVTLVLYIITYNCGFGPLPWTVMAEIFPANIKSAASSVTAFSCWFASFIITKFFHSVSDQIGLGGSFWIFSGFNLIAATFTYFYVLETKGKSFREIQDALNS